MKFDVAWADIATSNVVLKVFACLVSVVSVVLCVGLVKASTRPPVVVERGCETRLAKLSDKSHTKTEIEQFVLEAVKSRFDYRSSFSPAIFSQSLIAAHSAESGQMDRRGLKQSVVVNEVQVEGAEVRVDADRIIAWGKVRVALRFVLKLSIAEVSRSHSNPWGLVVSKIEVIDEEKDPDN